MLNWDLAYDYAAIYLLLIIIICIFMKKEYRLRVTGHF